MVLDLTQLCSLLQSPPTAPGSASTPLEIRGVNTLELAGANEVCFAERADQVEVVAASRAAAVVVPQGFPDLAETLIIRSSEPRKAFFRVAEAFLPRSETQGVHPGAVIDPDAVLGDDVAVGPCAVIAAGVRVGDRSVIGPGSYLGPGVTLGADCVVEANVSIQWGSTLGDRCVVRSGSVIGGEGFGFEWDGQGHRKIPQLGRVVIEDDVDIGCNCCVDRATLGVTRIGHGAKVDNLVQVAHNTDIGAHVILVSQSGVAGSSRVGAGAVIAGQVAVSDHVSVGAGARVGGQSGVTKDVPAGAAVFGTPARPIKDTLRELAALAQLPGLLKQVKRQEQELVRLRALLERPQQHAD